jgi:hypothetical protein
MLREYLPPPESRPPEKFSPLWALTLTLGSTQVPTQIFFWKLCIKTAIKWEFYENFTPKIMGFHPGKCLGLPPPIKIDPNHMSDWLLTSAAVKYYKSGNGSIGWRWHENLIKGLKMLYICHDM